jgi:hypothetical protein
MHLAADDALALTTLTNLTRLDLTTAANGVGTRTATAIARNLTQLQHLCLYDCRLQLGTAEGMACLEAIGRLTRLTYLNLGENPVPTQLGLEQLAGLPRLEEVYIGSIF